MKNAHATGKQNVWFHFLDVLFNIVVIAVIIGGVRTFLVSPFQVEGSSMTSTLEDNEYIMINKFAYHMGSPKRGEIVVFRPPNEPGKYYVKRVIGEPGDTVIIRDGNVYVQLAGSEETIEIDEPYLDERNAGKTYRHPPGSGDTNQERFEVTEGHYFLMGDNRQGSLDSRSFMSLQGDYSPFIAEDNIKGRVWFVALPITKIQAFDTPNYAF